MFVKKSNHEVKTGYGRCWHDSWTLSVPRDVRLSLLQSPYWMALDKQQFLQVVSKQMLIGYVQQLTGLVFVEGLIQGNITSKVSTTEGLAFVEGLIQGNITTKVSA